MWQYYGQERPPFAEPPGRGQESVWDYPRPPAIIRDERHVVVRSGTSVIADSRRAWRVCETASPPTWYLPSEDVTPDSLRRAPGGSFCEWKGVAVYFDVLAGDEEVPHAAWCYPQPLEAFAELAGAVAFYPGTVECFVDNHRVQPQPGRFYGGWVTPELAGPFKGEPGSEGW